MRDMIKYKNQVYGMARAVLVLDENVKALKPALEAANFKVVSVPMGTADDSIKESLLPHRIFVTKNSKDFIEDVPIFEYGIVSLDGLRFIDPAKKKNKTVTMISKALSKFKLISARRKFVLTLSADGKHKVEEID